MDRWGPKHVELNLSADWNLLIETTVFILLDYIYIYYKMVHGPYNVKLNQIVFTVTFRTLKEELYIPL